METTEIRPGVMLTHHDAGTCKGSRCPIHNPSDHALRSFPLDFIPEAGCMARIVGETRVPDPDDYKILNGAKVIWRNSAVCGDCLTEIVSTHRHDYVTCPCGKVSVDGGHSYLRRTAQDWGYLRETSIVINGDKRE